MAALHGRRLVLSLLVLLAACGRGLSDAPAPAPPSFWDNSLLIAMGRPNWVYYVVTNLPRGSVLYCPPYPVSPEGYPDWPKRLAQPVVVPVEGEVGRLHDAGIEAAGKKEEKEAEELSWTARVASLARDLWGRFFRQEAPSALEKDYLFLPAEDEALRQSVVYRYVPPDEFWEMAARQVVLVSASASPAERESAVAHGRAAHRLVLQVDATPLPKSPHNADWWREISVYLRPGNPTGVAADTVQRSLAPSLPAPSASASAFSDQLNRSWMVIRQTDLATGRYVDLLVDSEGKGESPWPPAATGSRIELWWMRWGTMRWKLIEAFSDFGGRPASVTSSATGPVVQGESYTLSWQAPGEEAALAEWNEDEGGEILDAPRSRGVPVQGSRAAVADNPSGAEIHALWARTNGAWNWVAFCRQPTQPLPRVEVNWPTEKSLPLAQPVEISGRWFPVRSSAAIHLSQGGRDRLLKEFAGKGEWSFTLAPSAAGLKPGPFRLWVDYPAPWTSVSERPESWKRLKAIDLKLEAR